MNVAISRLAADFDTTVTTIQTVIAFYAPGAAAAATLDGPGRSSVSSWHPAI
jgi:hypothetical protein